MKRTHNEPLFALFSSIYTLTCALSHFMLCSHTSTYTQHLVDSDELKSTKQLHSSLVSDEERTKYVATAFSFLSLSPSLSLSLSTLLYSIEFLAIKRVKSDLSYYLFYFIFFLSLFPSIECVCMYVCIYKVVGQCGDRDISFIETVDWDGTLLGRTSVPLSGVDNSAQ
jgi:hypothetical protein